MIFIINHLVKVHVLLTYHQIMNPAKDKNKSKRNKKKNNNIIKNSYKTSKNKNKKKMNRKDSLKTIYLMKLRVQKRKMNHQR